MICCHGYAGDARIADFLKSHHAADHHLIGFNFPDAGESALTKDYDQTSFGTIQELLPLFYLLKTAVINGEMSSIHLYGYSMGGAVVVNSLAILQNGNFDQELNAIGIRKNERDKILNALQKGSVILDCPLKSFEEIIAIRGLSPELKIAQSRYAKNQMCPIESLDRLKSLQMNVILYFHQPDEILSNRDDQIYIKRLKKANEEGRTQIVIGTDESGHNGFHSELWKTYSSQGKS